MRREPVLAFLFLVCFAAPAAGWDRNLPPERYGRVVIRAHSEQAGRSPVVFDHWLHRSWYTCRLCHVDLGFAMESGATDIRAVDNAKGSYCGVCHNGKMMHENKVIFSACSDTSHPQTEQACLRCHSLGEAVKKDFLFDQFTKGFPRSAFGNGINWEQAEQQGIIRLTDRIGEVRNNRSLPSPQDFDIMSRSSWMSSIIFSHRKHAVWLGCESCHPELFNVGKGNTRYSMFQISEGLYCGVCHGKVAFPLFDCGRCHAVPVSGFPGAGR